MNKYACGLWLAPQARDIAVNLHLHSRKLRFGEPESGVNFRKYCTCSRKLTDNENSMALNGEHSGGQFFFLGGLGKRRELPQQGSG